MVVEKELAAEFKMELVVEATDPLQDRRRLLLEIPFIVEPRCSHLSSGHNKKGLEDSPPSNPLHVW